MSRDTVVPAYKGPSFTVIEENGKLYARRVFRFRGDDHVLYQRLETREAVPPSKTWHGTTIAADRAAEKRARFLEEIQAFKRRQKAPP